MEATTESKAVSTGSKTKPVSTLLLDASDELNRAKTNVIYLEDFVLEMISCSQIGDEGHRNITAVQLLIKELEKQIEAIEKNVEAAREAA